MRLFAAAFLLLIQNVSQHTNTSPVTQQAQNCISCTCQPASINESIGGFPEKTPAKSGKDENCYDARTDALYRWYLLATIIGVVGACVGVVILIVQTGLTRRSVNYLVAIERAWVTVTVDWSPAYPGLSNHDNAEGLGHMVNVRITYKNDGRTPAWIIERRAKLEIFDHMTLPEKPPIKRAEVFAHGTISLSAGQEKSFDTPLDCKGRQTFDNIVQSTE
jgi:hypothetical protein